MTFYSHTLHADLETPVSVFLKLSRDKDHALLFESVEGRAVWANFSIIAVGSKHTVEMDVDTPGDVFARCRDALEPGLQNPGELPFLGGYFGYLSYDSVYSSEPVPPPSGKAETPVAHFFQPELYAVFDNRKHSLTLYANSRALLNDGLSALDKPLLWTPQNHAALKVEALDSRAQFIEHTETLKEHIRGGDIIQAVLSRRFSAAKCCEPFDVYRGLRTINPSPYLFFLKTPKLTLAGASPEVMIRVQKNRKIMVRPIAGTRPRGQNEIEDLQLENELLQDPKERAEHIMLVDLGRNDVGRVASQGSVNVDDLMVVEHYSHVMHIVSQVSAHLDERYDVFDAMRSAFPAGTLSGAPKVRAMQLISKYENRYRGPYGGAVGYFGPNNVADFGIAIRTLEASPQQFRWQAGAGIVAESVAESEADETEHKARSVVKAIEWAQALGRSPS